MSEFFDLFYNELMSTTWLEIIAVFFGIASVWFARKANILVYPTGIISTIIYIYLCLSVRLYADMGINFFYSGMSIYGWYMWTRKDSSRKVLPIRWNTRRTQILGIIMIPVFYAIILAVLLGFNRNDPEYIHSYVPYVDSFTTSIFLIGMWYMARKRIENWIYWIVGNIISIPLYFAKGFVFTSFQFTIFLVLAVMGLLEWKRIYEEGRQRFEQHPEPAVIGSLESGQI